MTGYDTYGVCKCGYNEKAYFGSLFHIYRTVCPECGILIEGNWKVKVLRPKSTAVWWKLSTWGRCKWEEKQ